tara:strand:- start:355 stop:933 length:579 start_codon:yes stop_codon:yes gene_type:complete
MNHVARTYIDNKEDLFSTLLKWNLLSRSDYGVPLEHDIDELPYSVYVADQAFRDNFWSSLDIDDIDLDYEPGLNHPSFWNQGIIFSVVDKENGITAWFVPSETYPEYVMVGPVRYSYLTGTKRLSYQHHITNEDLQTDAKILYSELVQTIDAWDVLDRGQRENWSFYRYEPQRTIGFSEVMNWRDFPDGILN